MSQLSVDERDRISEADYRRVLGHVPTGVSIVTAFDADHRPVGLTIGSFFSISLLPPLVGLCVAKDSKTWPTIRLARSFCVNVLAQDQQEICAAFARSGDNKFVDVAWDTHVTANPRINGSLAWIECDIDQIYDSGDHEICVAGVRALGVDRDHRPLVFFRGVYY